MQGLTLVSIDEDFKSGQYLASNLIDIITRWHVVSTWSRGQANLDNKLRVAHQQFFFSLLMWRWSGNICNVETYEVETFQYGVWTMHSKVVRVIIILNLYKQFGGAQEYLSYLKCGQSIEDVIKTTIWVA